MSYFLHVPQELLSSFYLFVKIRKNAIFSLFKHECSRKLFISRLFLRGKTNFFELPPILWGWTWLELLLKSYSFYKSQLPTTFTTT